MGRGAGQNLCPDYADVIKLYKLYINTKNAIKFNSSRENKLVHLRRVEILIVDETVVNVFDGTVGNVICRLTKRLTSVNSERGRKIICLLMKFVEKTLPHKRIF